MITMDGIILQFARTLVAGLAVLTLTACGIVNNNKESTDSEPGMAAPASFPHNKLLNKAYPNFRLDCFFDTEIDRNGKVETLHDRMISTGRGFVGYSTDNHFGLDGYYLFNFFGNTSYYVSVPEHSYKVAMTSPADDILRAYQDYRGKDETGARKELGVSQIGEHLCRGFAYKDAAVSREDWFDCKNFALVKQRIERPGEVINRKLVRFNPFVETTLLRLPSGFNFVKSSQDQK